MITLNLLPSKLKKEIESKKANVWVVGMFILSFVIFGLTVELLFATKKLLSNNLESLQEQYDAFEQYFDSERNQEIEEKINIVNKMFVDIDKIQKGRTSWSKIMVEFTSLMPSGVKLYELNIDKSENQVIIKGFAETREGLLKFEESLKNFKYFEETDLPSSFLIEPKNIPFEIKANLNQQNIIMPE